MRKALLVIFAVFAFANANAQIIPNPSLENWVIAPYKNPDAWLNSNMFFITDYGVPNVTEITPGVNGSAIKLETMAFGTDTIPAFITNGLDPFSGDGGVPFSDKPTTLSGYFKYSIQPGDSAVIIAVFKNSGTVISRDTIYITGSVPNFVFNNYALPHITAATTTPDSVIIFASASDLYSYPQIAGSILQMDDIALTGPGVTQTINGAFDVWLPDTAHLLNSWDIYGHVKRTTDKYSNTYAAMLLSLDDGTGYIDESSISVSVSLNQTIDTLRGFYKYHVNGNLDTAYVSVSLFDANAQYITDVEYMLPPVANYTAFSLPLISSPAPASAIVEFNSTYHNFVDSSKLYLDSIEIIPQTISVKPVAGVQGIRVYPNPATDVLTIDLQNINTATVQVAVYDMKGSIVYKHSHTLQQGKLLVLPVKQLQPGVYVYEVKAGEQVMKQIFEKR